MLSQQRKFCSTAVTILTALFLANQCHPIPECTEAALCKRLFCSILSSTSLRNNSAGSLRVKSTEIWWGENHLWGANQHSGLLCHQALTQGHRQDSMSILSIQEVEMYRWVCEGGGSLYLIVKQKARYE